MPRQVIKCQMIKEVDLSNHRQSLKLDLPALVPILTAANLRLSFTFRHQYVHPISATAYTRHPGRSGIRDGHLGGGQAAHGTLGLQRRGIQSALRLRVLRPQAHVRLSLPRNAVSGWCKYGHSATHASTSVVSNFVPTRPHFSPAAVLGPQLPPRSDHLCRSGGGLHERSGAPRERRRPTVRRGHIDVQLRAAHLLLARRPARLSQRELLQLRWVQTGQSRHT